MPIHANRIVFGADPEEPNDYFPFEDMRGRLQPKSEKLEVMVRPGHEGEILRKTGIRAVPSQILTVHYVLDFLAAKEALEAYSALIDGEAYQVIQHSESFGYFRVLDVVEANAIACQNVIGSILFDESGNLPTVCQYVTWTLLSTLAPE